jgi:type IV pilus assembly protein PilQ
VTGNLTLRLKNVPWDQAMDIILKTKGLAMRQNGNVMLIAPAAEIAAREQQEIAAKKAQEELEPLYSEIIEVKYAKATELESLLKSSGNTAGSNTGGQGSQFLSSRGSITVDTRTNSLLVRDTAEQLVEIKELIDQLDKPVKQVLIDSRIVTANDDFTKDLGVNFSVAGAEQISARQGTKELSLTAFNVNLPAPSSAGQFGLALAKLGRDVVLNLELSAMQTEGRGEIISSPRVVTSSQSSATIEQGTEIPYQEASSSGATSVSFKKAVLQLTVTPQITPDDRIDMQLDVSNDSVGAVFAGVPSIDTRSVSTKVLVENGETVVLGGVFEQRDVNSSQRVPFFGDLPYIGFLFKQTSNTETKRELLIFVTPKIIKDSLNL